MLAPSELQVTAINGRILLNMDERLGIEITSSGDLNISTNDEAYITGKNIALRAGDDILLATNESSIWVDEELNIKAIGGVSGI